MLRGFVISCHNRDMKVFVQVPCLNEEKTLPLVLKSIPKKIPGVDQIEILIIDDGSTDKTIAVAKKLGVKHFVRHTRNMGLARSFRDGVEYALAHGADIVVNTDGDNQYPQDRIPDLIKPILDKQAEIVVADRQVNQVKHFSPFKKLLQRVGSRVVNLAASTDIPDAASGFRAYSRRALMRLNIVTTFSYCMETIIQAGNKQLAITSIPVTTNPPLRKSRLFKSTPEHVIKSGVTILRAYIMYRPYMLFMGVGLILLAAGLIPFIRYLIFWFDSEHGNHIQSLILGSVLLGGAFLSFSLGIIADLIRINRILNEQALEHLKQERFKQ
jgi:glycosyltransferase involved in cell wall biosynthesis